MVSSVSPTVNRSPVSSGLVLSCPVPSTTAAVEVAWGMQPEGIVPEIIVIDSEDDIPETVEDPQACSATPATVSQADLQLFHPSLKEGRDSAPLRSHSSDRFWESSGEIYCPPMAEPWDFKRGPHLNVIEKTAEVRKASNKSAVSVWAPNCATFTEARSIPIPGVKHPPKPLRSKSRPRGLPNLPPKSRQRVEDDTCMADIAATQSIEAVQDDRLFVLEHPSRSLALQLDSWLRLQSMAGVFVLVYSACAFPPCKRNKLQMLITNIVELREEFESMSQLVCTGKPSNGNVCSTTGERHDVFDPKVEKGRVVVWRTGEESEYPQCFCEVVARAVVRALRNRRDLLANCTYSFMEIFSGPNAPLSREVNLQLAASFASYIPVHIAPMSASRMGLPEESSKTPGKAIEALQEGVKDLSSLPPPKPVKEMTRLQQQAQATGRQVRWGTGHRLVPEGLHNPKKFMQMANELVHPGTLLGHLPRDLIDSAHHILNLDKKVNTERVKRVIRIEERARELEQERLVAAEEAGYGFKCMKSPLNIPLMEWAGKIAHIEHPGAPRQFGMGLGIVGEAVRSPFFEESPKPATMTVDDLPFSAPVRRQSIIDSMMHTGLGSDP